MNQTIKLAIPLLLISVISFLIGVKYGNDSKNMNYCPYEGAECPNTQSVMQDYQLQYHNDTLWVFDGDRLVGTQTSEKHGAFLDSLILGDNL